MSFAQSKKWVFSLPNNVSSSNVQPQQKRKVDREKKMRAPDIRTVVRDQIASFDDLRIVEGVFHVVVQVFAAHGARVSQSLKCVAAELCGPSLSTKSRPQKVASFTSSTSSSRGPKSNKRVERLSLIIGALKICRRAVVLLPMPVERRQRRLQGKTIYGEKPLPFGEEIGSFFGPKE